MAIDIMWIAMVIAIGLVAGMWTWLDMRRSKAAQHGHVDEYER